MNKVSSFWGWVSAALRAGFYDLRPVVFILLFLLLALNTEQGNEIGLAINSSLSVNRDNPLLGIVQGFFLPILAISVFVSLVKYWTTKLLLEAFDRYRNDEANSTETIETLIASVRHWLPPSLEITTLIFIIYKLVFSQLRAGAGTKLFLGILFLLATVLFMSIALNLFVKWIGKRKQRRRASEAHIKIEFAPMRLIPGSPFGWSIVVYLILAIIYSHNPGLAIKFINTPTVFFTFLSLALSIFSGLTLFSSKTGLPFLGVFILWSAAGSYNNSIHELRYVDTSFDHQTTIDDAIKWAATKGQSEEVGQSDKIVLIAAAGGGLRAAYWTASVLAKLEDRIPCFNKYVAAISGVSGGTLGAASWITTLDPDISCEGDDEHSKTYLSMVDALLGKDYLAAAAGGLFFSEPIEKLLFLPSELFPHWLRFEDRGAALEKAWETNWCENLANSQVDCTESNGFADSVHSIWFPGNSLGLPVLLANGTEVATGKRVITAPVDTRPILRDGFDFFSIIEKEIRLSTLVLNSARFTYISPVGYARSDLDYAHPLKIVDGGYFENYGAETALEVAVRIRKLFPKKQLIIIQITSDPELLNEFGDSQNPAQEDCDKPTTPTWIAPYSGENWNPFRLETLAPIEVVAKTREARGLLATKRLRCIESFLADFDGSADGSPKASQPATQYFHFNLKCNKKLHHPPLGWLLAKETRVNIEKQLSTDLETRRSLNGLTQLFTGEKQDDGGAVIWDENCQLPSLWAYLRQMLYKP